MNFGGPNTFLKVGGVVLLLLGLVGLFTLNNPNATPFFWLDNGENWAHIVLGVVALIAAFSFGENMQKQLTILVGVIALATGVIGFFLGSGANNFFGLANLENPADNVLHLVVGVWALMAAFGSE